MGLATYIYFFFTLSSKSKDSDSFWAHSFPYAFEKILKINSSKVLLLSQSMWVLDRDLTFSEQQFTDLKLDIERYCNAD